ncbi:MAG TPA: M48 family metalloprotease [Opitutaceae bacterium]|jgi:Zn-dependent protease with chaperone function/competence protein ComGC|nr:M48 family metalloprotease [Opitutaceae bacterium]
MNTPASTLPSSLTVDALNLPKEKTYYTFVFIISVLVWLVLAITIVGLFYAALFAFVIWLGNGLLTAHLRAEAVRVDENQLPQLHGTFLDACQKLGVTKIPKLYVLQAGGVLNAFATKFSGRNFVVVYSDFIEAFGPDSPEIRFILGHELGHLKSNHIWKHTLLAPGIFMPLIGPAYLRACEASCDRYGAFAAENLDGAMRAMLTLSGGKLQGRTLDPAVFATQHKEERGFFISWHELTSPYPTLSQRVKNLLALRDDQFAFKARRSPLAYFFALFTPGGRLSGGAGNTLVFIVIIGLLAAMAIPAFQKVRAAAMIKACANNERMINAAAQQFTLEQGHPPGQMDDLVGSGKLLSELPKCPSGGIYSLESDGQGGLNVICSVHGQPFH